MSGTDFVFNQAKGKGAYYASLPAANDALIAILLKSANLEADSVLKDLDDFAALVAGTTDEATDASYARKTLASVTITVDDTNDRVDVDAADVTWTALAGGAIAKLVIGYDNDTTTGTDSAIVPISAHSFDVTPDGTDVTGTINVFYRAS